MKLKSVKPLGGPRDPRHGTVGAYAYWGCRCEKCMDANKEAGRRHREQALASLTPEDHGKLSTYVVGCRCEPCRVAARKSRRPRIKKAGTLVELSKLA